MIGGVPDDPHPPLLLGRGENDDHYMIWLSRYGMWHSPCHVYLDELFATDWDVASGCQGAPAGIRTRRRDFLWASGSTTVHRAI
jgi:hypothetical protein